MPGQPSHWRPRCSSKLPTVDEYAALTERIQTYFENANSARSVARAAQDLIELGATEIDKASSIRDSLGESLETLSKHAIVPAQVPVLDDDPTDRPL